MTTSSPRADRLLGRRGDEVVGLPTGELAARHTERRQHLAHEPHLLAQRVGRGVAVGLVGHVGLVAERRLGPVEGHQHLVGALLLEHEDEHRREPEHGVGELPARRRHVLRQGEEGAVRQRVPVDQQELGHGRFPSESCVAIRVCRARTPVVRHSDGPEHSDAHDGRRVPVDDAVGDLAHLRAFAHRRALDEREGVLLGHLQLRHQHALGPLDRLARLELLAEGVDLAGHRPQLPEPADGDLDRRHQVALLERLDEVRQRAGVAGLLDDLALAERGQHEHAAQLLGVDDPGRLQAVEPRHLDVEDRQVRQQIADQLDGGVAPSGLADDLVTLLLQRLAQVHADDGFVLGDHDPYHCSHPTRSCGRAVRPDGPPARRSRR